MTHNLEMEDEDQDGEKERERRRKERKGQMITHNLDKEDEDQDREEMKTHSVLDKNSTLPSPLLEKSFGHCNIRKSANGMIIHSAASRI